MGELKSEIEITSLIHQVMNFIIDPSDAIPDFTRFNNHRYLTHAMQAALNVELCFRLTEISFDSIRPV